MHISVHNVNTLQGFEMQISTNPPLIFVNCAQLFFSIIYSPIFFCLCFFCANHIFFENRGKFWHCQYSILVVECTFSDQKNSDKKKRLTKKKELTMRTNFRFGPFQKTWRSRMTIIAGRVTVIIILNRLQMKKKVNIGLLTFEI